MISIIMPVWNGARFMDRAIASVVCQTSPNWELLIVDDGSTDDSLQQASRWEELVNQHLGEEKIRIYTTGGSNSGMAIGANLAAEKARYDVFAYLHQDDLFFPRRVESLLPYFEKYDLAFASYEILENGKLTLWNIKSLWEKQPLIYGSNLTPHQPSFEAWVNTALQSNNLSVPLGVAHRRTIFNDTGGFQPGITCATEGVLWRRMVDRGARIAFCPVIAGRYIVRPDSQARTRRPFSIPCFEIDKKHPLGANGQYLDAEWFAALERKKLAKEK